MGQVEGKAKGKKFHSWRDDKAKNGKWMNWTTLYSVEGAGVYADNTTHGLYGRYMELLSQSIAIFKTEPER